MGASIITRVIYDKSGRRLGEVETEVQLDGKRIIRDYLTEWGRLEDSVDFPGRQDIYRHGRLYGFIQGNILYDNNYTEKGEVKSEESTDIVSGTLDKAGDTTTHVFEGILSIFSPAAMFAISRKIRNWHSFLLVSGSCAFLLTSAFYVGGQTIEGGRGLLGDALSAYNMAHFGTILYAFFGVFAGLLLLWICIGVVYYHTFGKKDD